MIKYLKINKKINKKTDICTNNYNDVVMEERNKTLGEYIIENQNAFKYSSGELSRIINSIRLAAKVVSYKVNKAGLVDIVGAAGEQNIQGEDQQKLDVYANDVFIQTLINREIVCGIASEENDDFIINNKITQNIYFILHINNLIFKFIIVFIIFIFFIIFILFIL